MATVLGKQNPPSLGSPDIQKHKQDMALANYIQKTQQGQNPWVYPQASGPSDWIFYQQQQQHHYVQPMNAYHGIPSYYQQANYQQQMLYSSLSAFTPQPQQQQNLNFYPQPRMRACTPDTLTLNSQDPSTKIPRPSSTSSLFTSVSSSNRSRDNAQRSSVLLRQQQESSTRRAARHRLSAIHPGLTRPPSSSSSTTSSLTGGSSDLSMSDRRSSVTSVSTTMSGSKSSFSAKLRRVFGKTEFGKDISDAGSVISSVSRSSSQAPKSKDKTRRRSITSLSNLFQKGPALNTTKPFESETKHTLPQTPPPHSSQLLYQKSPQCVPLSLPTSENETHHRQQRTRTRIQFCTTIQVHETFQSDEYDRRCDSDATCQKLTPRLAMKIKHELNEYKLHEMDVHIDSRMYTHFFY